MIVWTSSVSGHGCWGTPTGTREIGRREGVVLALSEDKVRKGVVQKRMRWVAKNNGVVISILDAIVPLSTLGS
jgi:hypothetical protein